MDRTDGLKNSRWPDRKTNSTTTLLWTYEVLLPQIGVVFLRCEYLPSQLLREQRVVGGEELDHEAKDGVFRPWRRKKYKLWLRGERRDEGGGGWEDDVTYFKWQNHAMAISGKLRGRSKKETESVSYLRLICFRVGFSRSSHTCRGQEGLL